MNKFATIITAFYLPAGKTRTGSNRTLKSDALPTNTIKLTPSYPDTSLPHFDANESQDSLDLSRILISNKLVDTECTSTTEPIRQIHDFVNSIAPQQQIRSESPDVQVHPSRKAYAPDGSDWELNRA